MMAAVDLGKSSFDKAFVYKGFSDGRQYSMQSAGGFVEHVARMAFGDANVFALFGKATLSKRASHRSGFGKILYNIDRYVISLVSQRKRNGDMLIIADQSDAYIASFVRPRVLVIVVHDLHAYLLEQGKIEGPKPSMFGRLLLKANMRVWMKADRLICVSENTRRDLMQAIDIEASKVEVIHNPLAMAAGFSSEAVDALLPPDARPDEAVNILMVGAGKPLKNAGVVARVLDILDSRHGIKATATMIGQPGAGISEMDSRIRWLSKLSQTALSNLYRTSTVLLMPSWYEGFGLPVLEAQAAALPVVCANRGALPEVGGDGVLLVDPNDPAEIAAAIQRATFDGALRQRLVEAGLANLDRFKTDDIVDRYVRTLKTL